MKKVGFGPDCGLLLRPSAAALDISTPAADLNEPTHTPYILYTDIDSHSRDSAHEIQYSCSSLADFDTIT